MTMIDHGQEQHERCCSASICLACWEDNRLCRTCNWARNEALDEAAAATEDAHISDNRRDIAANIRALKKGGT